ncbi:MAG: adenylosuccinate synthase [Acidobacteriota bacterium]|nr:adenylosuccinate synthase [Blastocatellia bacterium]MDW8412818.1 adenylosuccinate synthase [Acidobacteriota bacterium]
MRNLVIVGTQWGDEGKGKFVDLLTPNFDIVVRYQGGHNAGHTVIVNSKRFILRLIPSGILHPDKVCVIGNGVVVDPEALMQEIEELASVGVQVEGRLFVSDRASLILPYHRVADRASEEARGGERVGTTLRGIGPAYEDKVGRRALRACDLFDFERFKTRALANAAEVSFRLGSELLESKYESYFQSAERMASMVRNTAYLLNRAVDDGKSVLLEGAQGTMLDVDHGTFPYVTSSNAIAGGATTGTGLAPNKIGGVLGVSKAYVTRVGSGPFPTELLDSTGEHLRQRGNEYGSVTGRPRRTGWFDAVIARYSVMLNGIDSIALTKLDVLDELDEINVCIGYKYNGELIQEVPALASVLSKVEPVYKTVPGWKVSTSGIRDFDRLPSKAQDYVRLLEDLIGCPIGLISTGAERNDTVVVPNTPAVRWLTAH